eukprot:SAG31_NODE_706_length_12688_cov_41.991342_7_plen_292_part_00
MAAQAQQQHAQELARQREHEQMVAQIARTSRALDECCRPVDNGVYTVMTSRGSFIKMAMADLETAAPELLARMLAQSGVSKAGIVNSEGQVVKADSGELRWDPGWRGLDKSTRVHDGPTMVADSAAGFLVAQADLYCFHSQPYCSDLPTLLEDYLHSDPTTLLAQRFRLHVQHALLPGLQRVSALLSAHAALVPQPPLSFLQAKFPGCFWNVNPPTMFPVSWHCHKEAWETLVARWADGDLASIVPESALFPPTGLRSIVNWAITHCEERQQALIGCAATVSRGFECASVR